MTTTMTTTTTTTHEQHQQAQARRPYVADGEMEDALSAHFAQVAPPTPGRDLAWMLAPERMHRARAVLAHWRLDAEQRRKELRAHLDSVARTCAGTEYMQQTQTVRDEAAALLIVVLRCAELLNDIKTRSRAVQAAHDHRNKSGNKPGNKPG